MEKGNKDSKEPSNNYKHLKWPAIIMMGLMFLIVVAFDYCSRRGLI